MSWRATEKSARNSGTRNVAGPSPKPYMLYGSAITVSLFSIALAIETVHHVPSSEVEFESCYAGKEATHDTPLRQVHRREYRRTHNQRERRIHATPHRIVRSNMQEIKLRC